ncbi:MAG TPA: quinolinate synthase NadA [Planctomycetota bacterium]|nr:quinolinate synthase NadA [Planctomycetota bacterium]
MSVALDIETEIESLKKARKAVILAHYYQDSEIQDVADFVGDSLQLSRQAAKTDAEVIVFAGVLFMAETAKMLSPRKKVVLPDMKAGCSLVDSCPPELFRRWREKYADHVVVTYVNSSAEVKALSDYTCTSSNAEAVINAIPREKPIIFAPDRNLGAWLAKKTGRPLRLWQGACIVHETFSERALLDLKMRHPAAAVLAHPECEEAVLRHADYVGSTSGIVAAAKKRPETEFIIATEAGILHPLHLEAPGKTFHTLATKAGCACNECPFMKRNTLEKVRDCLRDLSPEIDLDPELLQRARRPIEAMFELTEGKVPHHD